MLERSFIRLFEWRKRGPLGLRYWLTLSATHRQATRPQRHSRSQVVSCLTSWAACGSPTASPDWWWALVPTSFRKRTYGGTRAGLGVMFGPALASKVFGWAPP